MKLRRVLGTLVTAAFLAMMLPPLPALAVGPMLAVITLDPLAVNSSSVTGSAPFDATSFVPPATNPGTDSSPTDHTVRTNDSIIYDFQFSVNGPNAVNLTLTSTLPTFAGVPVADWSLPLPAICGAGSGISNGNQTLTCVVGAVLSGSAQDVVASIKIRGSAPNNATLTPSVTVDDPGTPGTTPASRTGYWNDQSTPAATSFDTITAVAKYNAMKKATTIVPVVEPFTYQGESGVQGYYVDYPVLVREGDGSAKGKFGISPAPASFTITDTLSPGLNAILPASNYCGLNGNGITIQSEPYGAIGINGSTSVNAVVNSGTITCTQAGGAGTPVTITVTGADTSGSSFPINHAGGAGIDNLTYVVAGYMRLFVPDTGGNLSGGGTLFGDTYTGIDPGEPDESGANLSASVTLTAQGPAPAHGSGGKVFVQTVSENGFPYNNAQGPALTAGVPIVAVFAVTNTSTPALGSAGLTNVLACDIVDTTKIRVTPFDTSAGGNAPGDPDTNFGGAVHLSNINGGSFSDGAPPAGFTVLYGDSSVDQTCVSSAGFKTSASDASFTAINPITRVRFTASSLTAVPQQQLRVQLSETVVTPLAAGTVVNNDLSFSASSSTGGTGVTGTAHTNGSIFQNTLTAAKYIWATEAGASVFNANGAGAPSASGASSGSAGLVDTNQEIVAALDDDGSQGTLPLSGVVTCDLIPANLAVKDFDGTTGAAIATWGGPVNFARVSGTGTNPTIPGSAVQYSTLPTFGGDTCTDDVNFSATPPTPRSSIKRVRVEYTLPALTRERMYINMQVASAVVPNTVITNNSITTYPGIVTPLTPSETVTVEPETVQVTKSTTTPSVNAGSPGSFTIQGYVQGPGNPSSGTITVIDTLPVGLTYIPSSTVLTNPPMPTSWTPGSDNATPVITMSGSNQVLTWTLGTAAPNPGVFIQLPTIVFQVNTDISLVSGNVMNSVQIADTTDGNPGGAHHTATASINITNSGSFHISKTTPTPTIPTNGTISWALNYANTSGADSTSTDFIDELPYSGDVNASSFHGTLTLATVAPANPAFPVTVEYTQQAHGSINIDPGCTSNGGAIAAGTPGTTCQAFANATWCPALSGAGCPTSLAAVTAVRILGGDLPGPSGTRTINITATTNNNVFTDVYWNRFGARTQFLGLGLISQPVETVVPTPPTAFLTLVKSCLAPPTCISAAQAPGTDITYGISATNTGGHASSNIVITDQIPNTGGTFYMDFKLGTATSTFPAGVTIVVSYSSDPTFTTFTYTPVSGGGGAASGYDRNVTAVRWTMTAGQLAAVGVNDSGSVQFTAAIR